MSTAARIELHKILDGIATERGILVATDAALTLRTAAVEGRIDGSDYGIHQGCSCVVGHLVNALGWHYTKLLEWDQTALPGWSSNDHTCSPVEKLVAAVEPGDRPATSDAVRDLVRYIDDWLTENGLAVPEMDALMPEPAPVG